MSRACNNSNRWSKSISNSSSSADDRQRDRASDGVKAYIKLILDYIENKNWDAFERLVLSSAQSFRSTSRRISEMNELNGTLVHCCAYYDPPLKLLEKMIKIKPSATRERDILGRTPLHIAVGSGASEDSISFLVVSDPRACGCQDIDGRTPLHFACDSSSQLIEGDDPVGREPPSYNLVRTLLSGRRDSAALEDNEGMNAIEYALISETDMRTIRLLQRATQRQVRREKEEETKQHNVHRSSANRPTSLAARSA
ncbi:hypothetical protein THAOC_07243 [Thalassiosira oceanica]|uniref:Uncharacterized protein n=1 Tax=Thalassiosira oceanica TaxID=159749 RepID=K0T0T5_THAOC|nr:hypothetical protein THAOC_07243 [Thalassiosira oceanica]|eukprot:EJK71335.1 hypothetical protein THAOC_07243 [Thalassiosira oceanica]